VGQAISTEWRIALFTVAPFVFDRSWEFSVPPEKLWAALADTQSFTRWWPWLRSFDPVPLEPGATTHCTIGPPLPYVLRAQVTIVAVEHGAYLDTEVSGDVRGPARLEVQRATEGSSARLAWTLAVERPLLRRVAAVARPMLQWGHDWVVDRGVEQFRAQL